MSVGFIILGFFLSGGLLLLSLRWYWKRSLERENEILEAFLKRTGFREMTGKSKFLLPEEDYSEESSESRGIPSSPVMDFEDEEE